MVKTANIVAGKRTVAAKSRDIWRQNSPSVSLVVLPGNSRPGSRPAQGLPSSSTALTSDLKLRYNPLPFLSPCLKSYSSLSLSLKYSKGGSFSPSLSDSAAKNSIFSSLSTLHFLFSLWTRFDSWPKSRKMGFSKMSQAEGGLETGGKKWAVAGISIRAALKPISMKQRLKVRETGEGGGTNVEEEEEEGSSRPTTPTAREARIPDSLPCPAAPRKRRPRPSRCNMSRAREFFTPPDLESVFKLGRC